MEEQANNQERVRLERRKRITVNLEIQKKPHGYPVYLRITENGKHKRYVSTIVLTRKSDWDSAHQRIKPSETMCEEWQRKLDELKTKAEKILGELEQNGTASADKVIEELRYGAHSDSFLIFAEQKVSECRTSGRLSSMNKYAQVCRKFTAFMESRARDARKVTFKEIDYKFIADFDAFLQTLDNKQFMPHGEKPDSVTPGARKLHPNYIAKILQYMNTIFVSAEKAKLLKHEDNPFYTYHIKTVQTDREELTIDEVMRMVSLDLKPGSREWHSRNFFLFALYCAGVRIGDMLTLRWSNITDDNRLHYQMSKNRKIQDIPLLPPAIEILEEYKTDGVLPDDYIFPYMKQGKYADLWYEEVKSPRDFDTLPGPKKLLYKQTISQKEALVNAGLKIIRDELGLTKPLSTHISRHTFGRLAKEVHTDNSLVQGLMKHSRLSTTEKYMGRFSTDAQDEALKAVFQPMAPEIMRKKDILNRLAELSVEELEALLAIHKEKQSSK